MYCKRLSECGRMKACSLCNCFVLLLYFQYTQHLLQVYPHAHELHLVCQSLGREEYVHTYQAIVRCIWLVGMRSLWIRDASALPFQKHHHTAFGAIRWKDNGLLKHRHRIDVHRVGDKQRYHNLLFQPIYCQDKTSTVISAKDSNIEDLKSAVSVSINTTDTRNLRELVAFTEIDAPASIIWEALTSYDSLHDFIPGTLEYDERLVDHER